MKKRKVKIDFDGYWYWISSPKDFSYKITGKYLFFSPNKRRLIEIATREILQHKFHKAKVNSKLIGNTTEYVLCLYYEDDSRKYELADRVKRDYSDVKYRYWKSDQPTLSGQYSQEFLGKLNRDTRRRFTSKKKLIEITDPSGNIILRQVISAEKRPRHARKQ